MLDRSLIIGWFKVIIFSIEKAIWKLFQKNFLKWYGITLKIEKWALVYTKLWYVTSPSKSNRLGADWRIH